MARVLVEAMGTADAEAALPLRDIDARVDALHYEFFDVLTDDTDDYFEVSCGFRWLPPFDELLAVTAEFHVSLRCLYEEVGCGFMGAWRAEDGTVVQDDCIDC